MNKIESYYWKLITLINVLQIYKIKLFGARVGNNVKVHGKFFIKYCSNFTIGDNSHINYNVYLICRDKISIGKNVHLSSHVTIHTGGLDIQNDRNKHYTKPIKIEDNVWIATGVIINPGVTIGENSIVLPGAVVSKNIPKNCIVGGVPAKIIKNKVNNSFKSYKDD